MNRTEPVSAVPDDVTHLPKRKWVDRDRILALDRGLPILVIEGPSGYGKSVLAEMWLRRQQPRGRSAWVSLNPGMTDPVRLLDQILRSIGAEYGARQEAGISSEAVTAERLDMLRTHLLEDSDGRRIVLDDVHLVANGPSLRILQQLLTIATSTVRFCLTLQPTAVDLGLGAMTAEGQVTWIPSKSLALTRDEVEAFARQQGQSLSKSQAAWLYRATEGWPALVQLSLAQPLDAITREAANLTDSGPLRSYIYERFFHGLSEDDRDVLWIFACLGSAPIRLLYTLESSTSKVDLALSNFRGLGIVQMRDVDDGSILSLHALIREAARQVLCADERRDADALLEAASDWYWQNGAGITAVEMALEGGQPRIAIALGWLVELSFKLILLNGQHQTALDLIERWERVSGSTDDQLDSIASWALIFQRRFVDAEQRLSRLEARDSEPWTSMVLLQRAVLLALRDEYVEAGELAKQWIARNQGTQDFYCGVALNVRAFSLLREGGFREAHAGLREAMDCFSLTASNYGIVWSHVVGSLTLVQEGRYRAALAHVEAGLARCPGAHGFGSLRALLRGVEAFVRYERDEPTQCRDILDEALPLLSDEGALDAVGLAYAAAARLRAAAGDFGTALDVLCEGEATGLARGLPRLSHNLRAERALLLLRSGALRQAREIIASFPEPYAARTLTRLLEVRLAIADGDGRNARDALLPLIKRLRARGRQSRLCEALIQLALAEELCRSDTSAFEALEEALQIACAEGYLRIFVDEGKDLRSLIERWLHQSSVSDSPAHGLARKLAERGAPKSRRQTRLPADLKFNKREKQLLSLLDDGLSNAQLAKRCFLSEGTVKWYLHNLYEKLGVGNRTALLRAVRDTGMPR